MAEFDRRRLLVVEGLNRLPGVSCITPKGAFYAFPNISETGWKAKALASALLEDAGVATIGRAGFRHPRRRLPAPVLRQLGGEYFLARWSGSGRSWSGTGAEGPARVREAGGDRGEDCRSARPRTGRERETHSFARGEGRRPASLAPGQVRPHGGGEMRPPSFEGIERKSYRSAHRRRGEGCMSEEIWPKRASFALKPRDPQSSSDETTRMAGDAAADTRRGGMALPRGLEPLFSP